MRMTSSGMTVWVSTAFSTAGAKELTLSPDFTLYPGYLGKSSGVVFHKKLEVVMVVERGLVGFAAKVGVVLLSLSIRLYAFSSRVLKPCTTLNRSSTTDDPRLFAVAFSKRSFAVWYSSSSWTLDLRRLRIVLTWRAWATSNSERVVQMENLWFDEMGRGREASEVFREGSRSFSSFLFPLLSLSLPIPSSTHRDWKK